MTARHHSADRITLAAALYGAVLGFGLLLRIVLFLRFHSGPAPLLDLPLVIAAGAVFDVLVTTIALQPILLALALFRLRLLGFRPIRFLLLAGAFGGLTFLTAMEYFFFEEFDARFNHLALDYLLWPHEVFVNIWESYNVPLFVAAAAVAGVLVAAGAMRWTRGVAFGPLPWSARWRAAGIVLLAGGLSIGALHVFPSQVSSDRITSEIAQNGINQLVRAWLTATLDYETYYPTLPDTEAEERAARLFGFAPQGPLHVPDGDGPLAVRNIDAHWSGAGRPWDVVVILEESLGSEFIGALGHGNGRTSRQFDRWSTRGLLFTNLVATGNRTVRGLEGVLCSFIPLPGDSIVKRDKSENVASLARVLSGKGYRTAFLYGGYGVFDGMKPFMLRNGYGEFVEEPDYPPDAFRTIWGVADEYIFDALLARQKESAARGERFFGTVMTVSNHKPFTVPEWQNKTRKKTRKPRRDGAVAYADWALGRYLDQARDAHLLDHTVVLVVGDHGSRVYGSELIPAESYRIPALILAPDPVLQGRRLERLCSQVDLAPTLLSISGISCETPFLGEDVSRLPENGGRAFLQHNRDLGLLTDDTLVTLGLEKTLTWYRRSGKDSDRFERVPEASVTAGLKEEARDATAAYQVASALYETRRYRLPEHPVRVTTARPGPMGSPTR